MHLCTFEGNCLWFLYCCGFRQWLSGFRLQATCGSPAHFICVSLARAFPPQTFYKIALITAAVCSDINDAVREIMAGGRRVWPKLRRGRDRRFGTCHGAIMAFIEKGQKKTYISTFRFDLKSSAAAPKPTNRPESCVKSGQMSDIYRTCFLVKLVRWFRSFFCSPRLHFLIKTTGNIVSIENNLNIC